MLKPFDKQEDVPEALREHYSKREDGKWHADIPDDHPAVKHNAKLLSEKQAAETKVTQLTSDLESARAGNLGRGQVAVAKSEVTLLDEYKALGAPAELKTKVDEHATLKETETKRAREDAQTAAAKELGYNPEAFKLLANLPDFEVREKDGKKTVVAKVTEGDKVIEKPAKEFIESGYAASMPALQAKQGVQVPAHGSGQDSRPASQFESAREYGKQYNEERKGAATDLNARFNLATPA